MKAHFIASRKSLVDELDNLELISEGVRALGHVFVRDWLDEAHKRWKTAGQVSDNWGSIVKASIEGIAKADVIIAEGSHESFAVGYQVALAIQQKKPILLLRHVGSDKDAFVTGVESGWIAHSEYDREGRANLKSILRRFFDDNDIQTKDLRFNFFIDRPIYNYLKWAAFKSGKTKAEIIRDLVNREIDRTKDPS